MWGDEFARVLEYLLRVKLPNGRCAFDLDARNHEGTTFTYIHFFIYLKSVHFSVCLCVCALHLKRRIRTVR